MFAFRFIGISSVNQLIDQFALSDIQIIRPILLMPTVAISGTAIKRPVSDRVKPSFVIFDIRAL